MRESKVKRTSWGIWFVSMRRGFVTLIVMIFVFAGGTNLVQASSSTLPGDRLYPVKRTWENVLVFAAVNSQKREVLELEQENNRLDEVQQLFEKRRSASVDFSGLVSAQNEGQWSVSGVNVLISLQTKLPKKNISVGAGVHVTGYAQNGVVQADTIELVSLNSVDAALNTTFSNNNSSNLNPVSQNPTPESIAANPTPKSTETSPTQAPQVVVNPINTPQPDSQSSNSFKGIVQSVSGDVWTINGVQVNVSGAEISGVLVNGAVANVEGYFDQSGVFIARQVELPENNNSGNNQNNNNNSGGSTSSSGSGTSPSATPGRNYDGNNDDNHDGNHESGSLTKTPGSSQNNNDDDNNNHVRATETQEPEH
jgi:hypothetical protein